MITKSNQWKYTIKVKDLFENSGNNVNQELVLKCCERMISELTKIEKKVEKSDLKEDELDYILQELIENRDNFEFLKDLASGEISEDEWDDYDFDGDFQELFNDYLNQTYDLGDKRVITKGNVQEKFMFIN